MSSRRSRWGEQKEEEKPKVSDDEAMRALLSSAQARERERSGEEDRQRKRPRRHEDRGPQQQRLPENDSYYGPGGGDRRENRDRNRGNNQDGRDEYGRRQRRLRDDETDSKPRRVEEEEEDKPDDGKLNEGDEEKPPPTHKPNFGLSGALTKDAGGGGNVYKGVVLKFQEPPEARAPNTQWRFYVFKGKEAVETLHVSKQSAYLLGRNTEICDIPLMHPSLSSQHAVLQYRALPVKVGNSNETKLSCQPYILDLESTNGTFLNGVRIDAARYYQLKKGDVLTFGASTREYVLLTANTTSV